MTRLRSPRVSNARHYLFIKTGTDTNVSSTKNSAMRHHKNSDGNMGTKSIALLIELVPQILTGAGSSFLPQSLTVLWLRESASNLRYSVTRFGRSVLMHAYSSCHHLDPPAHHAYTPSVIEAKTSAVLPTDQVDPSPCRDTSAGISAGDGRVM